MKTADYVKALPDAYKKSPESNNYKLLQLNRDAVQDFREDQAEVQAALDIYSASGYTLDLYGATYKQPRGGMTDDQYRYVILQKAARNLVGGDVNSILEALAAVLNAPVTSFGLEELEGGCEVEITNLPYTILQTAGLTGRQVHQIVSAMLPAGVALSPLSFDGTFEFGATASEYDADAGFGDVAQTIGGYLGLLVADEIDIPV